MLVFISKTGPSKSKVICRIRVVQGYSAPSVKDVMFDRERLTIYSIPSLPRARREMGPFRLHPPLRSGARRLEEVAVGRSLCECNIVVQTGDGEQSGRVHPFCGHDLRANAKIAVLIDEYSC